MTSDQEEKSELPVAQQNEDPALLKVRGRFDSPRDVGVYLTKLTRAAQKCLSKHGKAKLRCIGPDSSYNAVRAISRVFYFCYEDNVSVPTVTFRREIVTFGEEERKATVIELERKN